MFPSMKEPSGLLQTDGKWPDGATLDLLTLDQLFDLYSTATTSLLDSMLPRHPVKSRIGLKSVWFGAECRQVHRRVRCAERRFRRTKDHDDRLSWIALLRSLHRLYHRKEAAYWENLVARNSKNPKRLWSSISGMLGKPSRPLETPSFTASDFLDMLTSKMIAFVLPQWTLRRAVFYNNINFCQLSSSSRVRLAFSILSCKP